MFTIGEVSKLLNIPTATLRFWEEKGLFSVGKGKNRYRRYSVRDLTQIADVIFFRNLGIPISGIGQLQNGSLDHYGDQLLDTQIQLEEKLRVDLRMYHQANRQLQRLVEVQRLMQHDYLDEDIPFQAVASFDYQEEEKLRQYAQDPSSYVRYFDTRDMTIELRGIIVPPGKGRGNLLWEKHPESKFLTFLIRELVDQDYESDVGKSLKKIQIDYKTRYLLARYMLTAQENGQRIDYLKGYLEVLPK